MRPLSGNSRAQQEIGITNTTIQQYLQMTFYFKSTIRVVNIGSGIGTDSIADSDTQYRISIGGTFKKRVPEGYRGGIDRYSDTDTSSVIIVCHYSLSYNKK